MLSGETTNTNFIIFGLTLGSNLQSTVLWSQDVNHYTTDGVW